MQNYVFLNFANKKKKIKWNVKCCLYRVSAYLRPVCYVTINLCWLLILKKNTIFLSFSSLHTNTHTLSLSLPLSSSHSLSSISGVLLNWRYNSTKKMRNRDGLNNGFWKSESVFSANLFIIFVEKPNESKYLNAQKKYSHLIVQNLRDTSQCDKDIQMNLT